ncbi:MAG: tripartite tricarboxylate transporter TctB family protein [Chloroflexota bacterium]|jgi:putative tricarboxylic transport membrane protein
MKRTYQIAGTVFLLFSAFVVWQSLELKFYTSLGPGPGFFPFWLAIFLGALSLGMIYQATFKPEEPMPSDFFASKKGYLKCLAIILALTFIVRFMDELGFRLSSFIFYMFLLFALGRQNIIVALLVSLAGSWGVYYVFVELLKVILPVGMFGF